MESPDINNNKRALTVAEMQHQLALQNNFSTQQFVDEDESSIDLREYWRVIMRHKFTIILLTFVAIVAAAIYTSMQTPIYRSSAKIQIDRQSTRVLQYESSIGEQSSWSYDFMETQYELLKSKRLAKRVADDLGLTSSKQFGGEKKDSFFRDLKKSVNVFLFGEQAADTASDEKTTLSPESSRRLVGLIRGGLSVKPVKNSRIVAISFDSPDPKLAAKVTNKIAESFISMNLERRFEASSYAKTFLEERIKQVRANLEDSEQKLIEYAGEREIIDFEKKQSGLMQRISALNAKQVEVETRRIQAQSVYNEMQSSGARGFTRIMDNPIIQSHKQKLAVLESEYEEKLKIFKPAYPTMQQLKSNIDELRADISSEVVNTQTAVKSDYKAAVREEAMLKSTIANLKKQILTMQAGSTGFQVLKRDVDTNRELYDGLLQRMKEVDVTAGIGTNNISIVDRAEIPGSAYKPNLKKNLMLALVLGLFGGVGLAFLFDYLDDTIKSSADLERVAGISVLGIIPEITEKQDGDESMALASLKDPTAAFSEAYRSLRTALTFSTTSGAPKVIHVTSCSAGEGKTTTAISLAIAQTQAGATVLLVDADLRNPSLHKELGLSNKEGLTNYLVGDSAPARLLQRTQVKKLWALPAGPIPPNPAELLGGGKMLNFIAKATKKFDMVILDSPPVLGLADALVLSNLAEAVLLVVDAGATRTGALEGTLQRLRQARANVLGTVLTKYGQGSSGYGYDYHYSYNYYGYGKENQPSA